MRRFEKLMYNLGATVEHTGGGCRALVFYMHDHAFVATNDLTADFPEGCTIELGLYRSSAPYNWMSCDAGHGLHVETTEDLQALDTLNEWLMLSRKRQDENSEAIEHALQDLWWELRVKFNISTEFAKDFEPSHVASKHRETIGLYLDLFDRLQ